MTENPKVILSEKLLAQLKAKLAVARTPKTRADLASMIRVQERVLTARQAPQDRARQV